MTSNVSFRWWILLAKAGRVWGQSQSLVPTEGLRWAISNMPATRPAVFQVTIKETEMGMEIVY